MARSKNKKSMTINKSGQITKRPPTNITVYEPKTQDEESWDFPSAIKDAKGDLTGNTMEWSPKEAGELLVGRILQMNVMGLGGIAFLIDISPTKEKTMAVLLKKGGKVLENRMAALQAKPGDLFAILYMGEQDTEKGNPMRLWKVKKITGE